MQVIRVLDQEEINRLLDAVRNVELPLRIVECTCGSIRTEPRSPYKNCCGGNWNDESPLAQVYLRGEWQ